MNRTIPVLVLVVFPIFGAFAQAPQPIGPLEDRLIGHWVLQGTLAGKETTHDVDAVWEQAHDVTYFVTRSEEGDR